MLFPSSADFFSKLTFTKKSETLSACQTVWIQIRTDFAGPDLSPKCLQRLLADDKSRYKQRKCYLFGPVVKEDMSFKDIFVSKAGGHFVQWSKKRLVYVIRTFL